MNSDDRRRLATMIDIVLRDTTTSPERVAAIGRIMAMAEGRSITDLVNDMLAEPGITTVPTYIPSTERTMAWREWKAKHEETVAECERLKRRVAFLEHPRFDKSRVKPDADGYIPYSTFLIALLAARKWHLQDVHREFAVLAQVDQQAVAHWRERGRVPYYYYEMLPTLPFGDRPRSEKMKWTEDAVAMLREYYAVDFVLPDAEIANDMSHRLGIHLSQHAVHCKADGLGLLRNIKRVGRKLKAN